MTRPAQADVHAASDENTPGKKVFIKTFGCQMNVYDSERMLDVLAPAGYSETQSAADADLVILNTCHIREKAAEKVYSDLGRLRKIRDERRRAGADSVIAVAGCVAQAEGREIARRSPGVDIIVGPQSYQNLPHLLEQRIETGKTVIETEFPAAQKFAGLPDRVKRLSPSAFLTVQEGCDKFCTFCVVPYTRGAEYSRRVPQLLEEASRLVDLGVKEITLLGQNVNAYSGKDENGASWSLAMLLDSLSGISGLERLRYTTSHPTDMSPDLIEAHRGLKKLMPYLHLPFQAGSDRILKAMNRKHTVADYLDIIARMREVRPDIALSTDVIVGYPGETEADFNETLNVVETVKFAQAYSFKYSPRPGTPAATAGDQVSETEKSDRLTQLQDLLRHQQMAFNFSLAGRDIDVLWEKHDPATGRLSGRSPYLQQVHAEGSSLLLGSITSAKIVSAGPNSLSGVINIGHEPVR